MLASGLGFGAGNIWWEPEFALLVSQTSGSLAVFQPFKIRRVRLG